MINFYISIILFILLIYYYSYSKYRAIYEKLKIERLYNELKLENDTMKYSNEKEIKQLKLENQDCLNRIQELEEEKFNLLQDDSTMLESQNSIVEENKKLMKTIMKLKKYIINNCSNNDITMINKFNI